MISLAFIRIISILEIELRAKKQMDDYKYFFILNFKRKYKKIVIIWRKIYKIDIM